MLLTSPASYIFRQQLNQLVPVVTIAQCCWFSSDRELDRQQQLGSTRSPRAGLDLLMRTSNPSFFAELDSAAAAAAAAFTGL